MATNQDTDFLTVAEAAKLLKVSTLTLHRWLKAGRLPAYHVGPKAVRIRRGDLAAVLTPAYRQEVTPMTEAHPTPIQVTLRPLSENEVAQALAALKHAQAHRAAMIASRSGQPLAESWPLIREERERRAEQL